MDEETLNLLSFLKVSPYRRKILISLKDENKTPTQISNDVDDRVFHVSKILREFKDRGLAVCVNEHKRKYRYYQLTEKGRSFLKYIEE